MPTGIYVWGTSRYDPQPSEDVIIEKNEIEASETGISLNGTKNVRIKGNVFKLPDGKTEVVTKRSEGWVRE